MTSLVRKSCELDFGCKIDDQSKSWSPHICCALCENLLSCWLRGKSHHMSFPVHIVRRESKDHSTDCCFCLTNIRGITNKSQYSFGLMTERIRLFPLSTQVPILLFHKKHGVSIQKNTLVMQSSRLTKELKSKKRTQFSQKRQQNITKLIRQNLMIWFVILSEFV